MKTVLFGAFDRHNLGDILLAHMAGVGAGGTAIFAGLADRDLTACGGQRVVPLSALREPLRLIHVGGELLDCDAEQAAFMLGEPCLRWGRAAPYVAGRDGLPPGSRVEFRAVGGVGLDARPAAFRAEVLATLRGAAALTVRDRVTQAWLAGQGIAAPLEADPVTRVAAVFGERIRARLPLVPGDYLAVQFAAECGDDASLAAIAQGLERSGLPVVLFRAGAAPWHDDLEPYRRLLARLAVPGRIFESLDVWDICALLAGSRGYVGTSLHGRVVAAAFGRPATSLERAPGSALKLRAYLATWSPGAVPLDPATFASGGRL